MLALGDALADVIDESDEPVDFAALRANFLEPILALSWSLPIFARAIEWGRNRAKAFAPHPLVFEGRTVGFDVETLLLDDFYQNGFFASSLRSRVAALMSLMREELTDRDRTSGRDARLLVLGANSVLDFTSLLSALGTATRGSPWLSALGAAHEAGGAGTRRRAEPPAF
jgi:hypothetical protein